jgi:sialate O-acetylesterase
VLADEKECFTFCFKATAKSYKRIACVGDSLTSSITGFAGDAYPELLAELLGADFTVSNFGAGGTSVTEFANTTEGDHAYSSYMTYKDYHSSSIAFEPDLVIIMLGTNDTKKWDRASSVYKRDYIALINSYKAANPDVDIVISTSPEVLENNSLGIPVGVISNYIYPLQLEIANEVGATVIDFHKLFAERPESIRRLLYRDDGVHITRDAALELAALIKELV